MNQPHVVIAVKEAFVKLYPNEPLPSLEEIRIVGKFVQDRNPESLAELIADLIKFTRRP